MRKLAILVIVVFLASCSQDSPEALQRQLIQHKDKVAELNSEIAKIEEKLEAMSDTSGSETGTVVRIKEVQPEVFNHFIEVSGKVIADEEAMVSAEINGKINRIHIDEGEYVKEGQLLISLNTDVTEKNIQEVKTNLQLLEKLFEKQERLWEQNVGTEIDYLTAKNNLESAEARLATLQEQLDMAQIRAPFGGIVEDIMVKKGEMAMPGSPMLYMVNMKDFNIEGNVSENYLNDIREGEIVEVSFPTFPSLEYELPITRVGSVIDNMSRTFQVELKFTNQGDRIKPNQLSVMKINDYTEKEALVVPSIIIKQDVTGNFLYVVKENGEGPHATKVYVSTGRSYQENTMVTEGLNKGDLVIVEGYNLVSDGTPVEIISE